MSDSAGDYTGGDPTDSSSVSAVNGSDAMSDAFTGNGGLGSGGFGGMDGFDGGYSPTNFGSIMGDEFGYSPAPHDSIVDSAWGQSPNDGFLGKAKGFLGNLALSKGAQALGLPGNMASLAYSGLTAPQGKGDTAMGATLGQGLMGPFGGLVSLANAFGAGIPTLGESIAAQGGYKGGDAPNGFNGGATSNSGNTGNENGWGTTLGSLGQLYSMYSRNKQNDAYTQSLANMYGQNSPYAQQLSKQLAARDAAAGRRTQYGPRSVELQAALAKAAAGVAPSVMQGQQNGFQNTMQMMQQLGALQKMGAFSKLGSLFGNGSSGYSPVDYSGGNQNLIPQTSNMFDNMDFSGGWGG